jgi:hypothetical protein
MARIELTLTADYVPTWGLWEGVREFIQNAIDAQEHEGRRMHIEHRPRTNVLSIVSEGVVLNRSVLLIGMSTKRGKQQRGQHGEGFDVGALALVRAGHELNIWSGDEKWSPYLEPSETFDGERVLTFQTRKQQTMRREQQRKVQLQICHRLKDCKYLF